MSYFYLIKEKDFIQFSKVFSRMYFPNFSIILIGSFGVGKTLFSKNFISDLFNFNFLIKSPSYSFCDAYYFNNTYFYHIDLYKFSVFSSRNLFNDFIFEKNFFFLIEWGEKILLEYNPDILLYMLQYSDYSRIIIIKSHYICINNLFLF